MDRACILPRLVKPSHMFFADGGMFSYGNGHPSTLGCQN